MSAEPELTGGIIAAGLGSRLRAGGYAMAKPLVPVAGLPLIGSVIRNFVGAGIRSLRIIVNEREQDCVAWARERFPGLDLDVLVKTTASSLESFLRVVDGASGRILVSTVDAWCREGDFARFVAAARARPADATVLAVTPLVDDERPLWADVDAAGRITALGGARGAFVTAGFYLVPDRERRAVPPAGLGRLREYLAWLARSGTPLYGEVIQTVVDVDRAQDVALAESLALTARRA